MVCSTRPRPRRRAAHRRRSSRARRRTAENGPIGAPTAAGGTRRVLSTGAAESGQPKPGMPCQHTRLGHRSHLWCAYTYSTSRGVKKSVRLRPARERVECDLRGRDGRGGPERGSIVYDPGTSPRPPRHTAPAPVASSGQGGRPPEGPLGAGAPASRSCAAATGHAHRRARGVGQPLRARQPIAQGSVPPAAAAAPAASSSIVDPEGI